MEITRSSPLFPFAATNTLAPMNHLPRHLCAFAAAAVLAACAIPEKSQPSSPIAAVPREPAETAPEATLRQRFRRPIETLFNGQWQGSLAMRQPLSATSRRAPPDPSDLVLKLVVEGTDVRVYLKEADKWIEAMPGQFVLLSAQTNATIVGIAAEGSWIENWAILLTAENDDSAIAEWTRVVNNLEPGPNLLPAFGMAARGTLRRSE